MVVDVGRIVRDACRRFARAADWQRSHIKPHKRDSGPEDSGPGYRLSENHEGLHSGRYISVTVHLAGNALLISGGYYDRCLQPMTVYNESVTLRRATACGLSCLLMDVHDGLSVRMRTERARRLVSGAG